MIDLNRYKGRWFEIAHYSNWFERGAYATADYEILPGGELAVINTSYLGDGTPVESATGRAVVKGPFELGVSFGMPFDAQYKIELVGNAPDYGFSIVGNDNKSQLWILTRRPVTWQQLDGLLELARVIGYDITRLIINTALVS